MLCSVIRCRHGYVLGKVLDVALDQGNHGGGKRETRGKGEQGSRLAGKRGSGVAGKWGSGEAGRAVRFPLLLFTVGLRRQSAVLTRKAI